MDCDEIIDQLLGVGQQHRDTPRTDITTLTDPCSSVDTTATPAAEQPDITQCLVSVPPVQQHI
jgi:hypothetical protein